MKFIYTFLLFTIITLPSTAQKLTGIWRGHFVQQGFDMMTGKFKEDRYKYEVQINNLANNALSGVTYSYRTTVFYGKASMQGVYNKKKQTLILKENKLIETKITDGSTACVMTCYLDYYKNDKKEILTGTYTSINTETKGDCGSGTVYLERVKNSDFELEPFLKNPDQLAKNKPISKPGSSHSTKVTPPIKVTDNKSTSTNSKTGTKKGIKPGAEDFVTKGNNKVTISTNVNDSTRKTETLEPTVSDKENEVAESTEIPKVLLERKNELAKRIVVNSEDVKIEYFDNGQIDNDSITVYLDNKVIINGARLSYSPITLNLHLDEKRPKKELITVANNLGSIPPNTALMVITSGKNRYEVFITSDKKKNAKVIFEYNPKGEAGVFEQ